MENIAQQTLAGIALSNHAFIPVLEKYSLDFCCRGKRTLEDVCTEKNIPVAAVVNDLQNTLTTTQPHLPFTDMTAEQLITYIMIHHHFYVKNSVATIHSHIQKVATKHGERYPHMQGVLDRFSAVVADLLPHMEKEERILFPRIKQLVEESKQEAISPAAVSFLAAPIQMMEAEHDAAGQLMFEIRELTNNYIPPSDACTTHRVCLDELKAFEKDLHQHVHLENNILFPKALSIVHSIN